ncbi:MAG: 16S rRNA (adenine(1518)-N(6)/adenine(1519)-N(6))-dimethyltransferase RsmA [Pyrinomonadaceae bacterium]
MRAKKSLGQHFLVDERAIEQIVAAVATRAGETIIEIGPGRGALTARLLQQDCRFIAVEFDRELVPKLREEFKTHANFTLIEGDALETDFCAMIEPATQARVVANLPYYISTAILQRLIEQRRCFSEFILMLQREVVERIIAPPGSSERGYLTVFVEAYCETEALFDVAPEAFDPAPKIWSTVARLRVRPHAAIESIDEILLWEIVSAGFAQRRKTIFNNLRHASLSLLARIDEKGGAHRVLESAGIEPQRRAETLTVEEWANIARTVSP